MQTVEIPGTTMRMSRFVFGTASLFNAGSSVRRQRILSAAVDAGFTHFDTAPYYGFGVAERDLSVILRSNAHVTLTTKVGLYSRGGESQSDALVFLRKVVGRAWNRASSPIVDFSIDSARRALEGSLRRIGRDHIDVYMLHEPIARLVEVDEWQRWLEQCVAEGKVRHFGMALNAPKLSEFLLRGSTIGQVIQVLDSLQDREADVLALYGMPMQITYGYVTAALRKDPAVDVSEVLRAALLRNRDGAVIVSSRTVQRIYQFSQIVEESGR